MAEVKQYNFYYGAILNIILSKNPDASPTLLEMTVVWREFVQYIIQI